MITQAIGLTLGVPFIFLAGWTLSVPIVIMALTGFGYFKGLYDANIWASLAASCASASASAAAEAAGARCAVSDHWGRGGEGALELADAVMDACEEPVDFRYLYDLKMKLRDRVELIAREIYGADGVVWSPDAEAKSIALEKDPRYDDYATMMVKTHLSLSHDPALKGVPKGWVLPIRDVLVYSGAKFLCPCAGTISLMPGTSSNPGFRRVDVDVQTGRVSGLF